MSIEKYNNLIDDLYEIRKRLGPGDHSEEDDIMDELDDAWWKLSGEERDIINADIEGRKKRQEELRKIPEWREWFEQLRINGRKEFDTDDNNQQKES